MSTVNKLLINNTVSEGHIEIFQHGTQFYKCLDTSNLVNSDLNAFWIVF